MNQTTTRNFTTTFAGFSCYVQAGRYRSGRPAIMLCDEADGRPVATASVDIPDAPLPSNAVWLKEWSENEGMAEALIHAGVIYGKPMAQWPTGFVTANLWLLTPEFRACLRGGDV